jgi:serine/threonine protein kinase
MSALPLSPGAVFAGRYQIVRCIAQGGMGAVYEVIHIETERRCALKVMLPSLLQSDDMRARFRQEARVTVRVASEYIVDVLDAGIDHATQTPFLVMELLEGEELHRRLRRLGRFAPHEVVTYLHQASLALDKAHRASIVHRDLKPSNLFLSEREDGSPRIKVFDFGIAKLIAEGATGPVTQTLGTPIYMAPEQFHFDVRLGPAVDIYALGMIAFTLLTGKSYWHDEASVASSPHAVYAAILSGPQEPACARAMRRGVALPPAFDAWFAKVTALEPRARFPTASSALAALGEVFGIPVAQRAPTPTPPPVEPAPSLSPSSSFPASTWSPHPAPTGIAAGSTTAIGSQALSVPSKASKASKLRGFGAAMAVALGTALVIAFIAGRALPTGEKDSGAGVASALSSAPVVPEATKPIAESLPPGTRTAQPTGKPTAQPQPTAEPRPRKPPAPGKPRATSGDIEMKRD